ncbi:acyl-CoA carboxylase subunit epsilon [Flexivirga meconopsidis]|uniref:acyl-CoA carboxylase subunit epsilon n=1 Tax=Flexivirga meconopsidis TaxID=2977121 RepID=UPI002240CF7C
MSDQQTPEVAKTPQVQVLSGNATPEEVAAIVAVLSAVGGGDAASEPPSGSAWAGRGRPSWRSSGLPY